MTFMAYSAIVGYGIITLNNMYNNNLTIFSSHITSNLNIKNEVKEVGQHLKDSFGVCFEIDGKNYKDFNWSDNPFI